MAVAWGCRPDRPEGEPYLKLTLGTGASVKRASAAVQKAMVAGHLRQEVGALPPAVPAAVPAVVPAPPWPGWIGSDGALPACSGSLQGWQLRL